ncbi:Hemicentin-1 [Aphis craccivora]|uniref:Hemicentin-1 n=1 Tax=Aphis craccivora TaxID=307492 RepID=A0A6G0ZFK7_APHCR|nr:Hemicentin-1 [Aphis craccivora]
MIVFFFFYRSYWSTEPNSTLGFLVMDNITALDEGVYKCEITYTKVHEGCNIVQFINLTTYTDPESISVGTLVEPNDLSAHNYIDPTSDFYDDKNSDPKFGLMKKLTSGAIVGPVDEGNKIRLVCRAGRARPVPQVTWWQHSRGPIYDSDLVDYQYRKVDSDLSDDVFSYSGLWVAQSVLTVVGKRGANGRYECRVKTATDSSPILTSNVEVTVNVSPYSVEMSTSSSGATVTTVSKVDDRSKSQNDRNSGEVVYAETTEGQPLVIRCAARGARPQANVTWYYYYKDQENDDDNDYGSGIRNEQNVHAPTVQSSKHGAPVMLGNSQQSGGSTARSPSDYLISEQRRMEGGAEIIGPVEIAQHTEYQADGTRDTHSQLSMSQLHRQQDGSILRCDAFNNVGSSPNQPLTVNMTIRVKYIPTAWVVPITDGENSGAIVEDEIRNDIGQQRKGGVDNSNNINPITIDASKDTYDGSHYQTILYTVVVNETKELRLNCAYHANPDKLRTPVKWYRDGIELQLVDEEEPSSSNQGSSYAAVTPATGTGTLSGSSNGANTRFRMNPVGNVAKYARVKGLANGNGGIHGDGNGEDATVLIVRKLTRSDSGRYECRVRNSVGAANSTNFANVRVQCTYNNTPKVKLHVILDDSLDENQTSSTASSSINNNMVGSNPIVLESEHRNVTLRCAVQLEEDQQNIEDTNSDPSLNLTSVHWYWNGVQMQLPNCTRSTDSSDIFGDEEDGDNDFDIENNDSENNAMNFNYETSEPHGEGEYDSYAVDNDTRRRNKKQRKVVCTDRELILVNVTKNIHGNYSCRARNAAGLLTPMSDQTPLIVYFAPGPVTLEFSPRRVIKGRNVTLRCNAQYLGRPQHPTRYSWFRDGHPFYHQNQGLNPNVNSGTGISIGANGNNGGGNFNPEWFVDHVSLETRANFTCSAYNEGGVTYSEPVYIEVFAPPNYITGPPQYLGVAYNATHVNASCTVECYPHCSVNWLRRGILIDPINNPMDKERYSILTEYLPAERLKNDFEAVRSILIWRMDNWPGGRGLDPITDSTEYSCRSSGNEVGPPVSESIMNFSVEYPPGNMTVSKTIVHVSEGNIPEKVFCHAEGRPSPAFEWRFIPNTNNWNLLGNSSQSNQLSSQQRLSSIVNTGNSGVSGGSGSASSQNSNQQQLVLNSAVGRNQAGYYACVARNTHGNGTVYTYLDVMYKPSCQLRMITVDQFKQESSASLTDQSSELEEFLSSSSGEKRILVCSATANPGNVQYTWTIRNSGRQNDTSTSLTSDSPATERVITISVGSPSSSGSNEMDSMGSYNRSILILQDRLEVSNNDDDEGRGSDNIPSNGASEGVRTYVCTVNNTVGFDQCSIQVQAVRESDAPWWKQLLATIGLGGLPVMVVLVALVVILLLIVIVVIVILLLFVCKNRYIKPGNGVSGGRQKYVKQKYPSLTAYRVPVVWRRHRGRGLLLNISKVRQNPIERFYNDHYCSPEGSATTSNVSGANPATAQQCTDHQSSDVPGNPKPPPGYDDDHSQSFASQRTTSAASVVGKWPLKPGVLVHSKQQLLKLQSTTGQSQSTTADTADSGGGSADKTVSDGSGDKHKSKKNQTGKGKPPAPECMILTNETQSARAARIRRMMIGSNNNLMPKKPSPASPPPEPPVRGQSSDTGAGRYPSSVTDSRGGAGQQQDNESNLGATGDSKAAFYENLPFHGMRPPPNQSSAIQSSNSNGNAVGRANYKPPLPLPPASDTSPSPSLIHRSPNGGYVSLLRRSAVPESDAAITGRPTAAVRFNSLQRPNRGSATAWQRRDRQFRSMRTVGTGGGDDKSVAETSAAIGRPTVGNDRRLIGRQDDNNNDSGGGDEPKASTVAIANRGGDGRKDAFSASTFPKPAPRTRVPSASVAPPSLSRRDTYENLQQLLNGAGEGSAIGSNKLTGVGIGARSLDEFYRMQIQQQHQLLYRVAGDDSPATALTSGYSTVGGGVVHHRQQQQQQQQQNQQSIEMTQFEMTGGPGREDVYQKSQKHQQQNAVGRYNNDDDGIGEDKTCKSMNAGGGGTMGRRRRANQQALDGGGGQLTDHYYTGGGGVGGSSQHLQQQYHHHQHHHQQQQHGNNRRRSNADGPLVQPTSGTSNYNTVSGVGYYAADVYASMGARQQQSKRQQQQQQQRPYGGGGVQGAASAGNVSDEQTLTAKRSWRRQQNRRRRAGVGGGVVAVEPDDDADQPQPAAASDYAADAEADDPPSPQPLADRYRSVAAAVAELDVMHHHRQRQKSNCNAVQPAAEMQQANGGGTNKNVVKFHDVGREIDV